MFVIAFKERYREEYYTGKRYKYDGWVYPGRDELEFAKVYKTRGTAERGLKSVKENCYYEDDVYIKEIK